MGLRSFVRVEEFCVRRSISRHCFHSLGMRKHGFLVGCQSNGPRDQDNGDSNNHSVPVSGTKKFTASVANTSNTAVTWQVNGTTGGESTHGTIDATGLYTAPAAIPSPATVTIAAISQAQPTKMATAQAIISTACSAIVVADIASQAISVQSWTHADAYRNTAK